MKRIAEELNTAFFRTMRERSVPPGERLDYLKWLRFYLDFCAKYRHPPGDPDSMQPFLRKLAEKHQAPERQEQAAASVGLYYDLRKMWTNAPEANVQVEAARAPWDECYVRLRGETHLRQYSPKTLQTYAVWIRQFQEFVGNKAPLQVNSDDARRFLTHLAVKKRVVASTQNQAFNALLFLYRHILKTDYDLRDTVVRARRPRYIPVVLSREEIDRIVDRLKPAHALAVQLLYGCGLRLFECLNLRVHCFNFDEAILTVHDGKGKKDRAVPLPRRILPALRAHLKKVGRLHELDMKAGYDGVFMPGALDRKWKTASKKFIWQWFFPAKTLTLIPGENERRRYHMHETELQKALRKAVRMAKIPKRVTCHTFRHSFASHLLRANYDMRTIQQLLGHSDIRTTMIYTHTVKSRTIKEVGSPLDFSPEQVRLTEELS
jgi:integron integrase